MNKLILSCCTLLLLWGQPLHVQAQSPDQIHQAVIAGNSQQLSAMRQAATDSYTQAYLDWRLAGLSEGKQKKQLLKQAQKLLTAQLKANPRDHEAMVLLGAVHGDQIDGVFSAIRLGKKAENLFEQAAALAPDNPRLVLQRGVSMLFKPASFGGGAEKASGEFENALSLFKQSADSAWPNWGEIDTYAWLGQALAKQGKRAEALAIYQQGLVVAPGHVQLSQELIPALSQ